MAGTIGLISFTPGGIALAVSLFFVNDILLDLWGERIDLNIKYLKGTSSDINVNWAIDPSGYVYEAVTNNRLKDVKCEIYYLDEDTKEVVLWNAKEYNQVNPFYTDSLGQYAWDVPEGKWKVVYSLDGYQTTSTEWLEVPPPQTDVNIGLRSLEKPTFVVKEKNCKELIIEFNKYMDPDTIRHIKIRDKQGNDIEYIYSFSDLEKSEDGNIYSKEFKFSLNEPLNINEEYSISTESRVKSYAGISAGENIVKIKIEDESKPEDTIKLGDVNKDGVVDTEDARMIFKYYIGAIKLTDKEKKVADVNKDGVVDTEDARKILLYNIGQATI